MCLRHCCSLMSQQQFTELYALLKGTPARQWSDSSFTTKVKAILKSDPLTSKGYQLTQELVMLEQEY